MLNNIAAFHPAAAALNSYESIQTYTIGAGGATDVTFSIIPSTYKHLQIRAISRTSFASYPDAGKMQFNGDTGNNYAWHRLSGDGSTATAGGENTKSYMSLMDEAYAGNTSGIFTAEVIDILDYANTSKYKTSRALGGLDANGSGSVRLHSGLWQSTSAITSIKLFPSNGNYVQYTQFALYGIKG